MFRRMLRRRQFLTSAVAAYAGSASGLWAQDRYDQNALLSTYPFGTITLMHLGGLNGQLDPVYRREPAQRYALKAEALKPPNLTGEDFRIRYGIGGRTQMDYALTHEAFAEHAADYGPMGGIDRIATICKAIRADQPGALLLSGGGNWPGSFGSLQSGGADMMAMLQVLGCDASTLGSEITTGASVLEARIKAQGYPMLAQNVMLEGKPPAGIAPYEVFERAGQRIAVIGQALPFPERIYPSQAVPDYTFGIGVETMRQTVEALRAKGVNLIVVLSQNGFVKDMQMARLVNGIDVILSSGDEVVTPEPEIIGKTHIIASGGHGRFVSRLDVNLTDAEKPEFQHTLIPVFSDLIAADADVAEIAQIVRAPFTDGLDEPLGTTTTVLSRGGTFQSSWDDVICQALMQEHDVEIALSPGLQWGASLLPGQTITRGDVYNVSGVLYAQTGVVSIAGSALKDLLEVSAEGVFAIDPLARSGPEMLRAGGLAFMIKPDAPFGERISGLANVKTGQPIDPARDYRVASWGVAQMAMDGPELLQVLETFIRQRGKVGGQTVSSVKVI